MNERSSRHIFITEFDVQRLEELIERFRESSSREARNLDDLEQELQKAEVIPPEGIPPDVITMNSTVCLTDLDSGQEKIVTLVFPSEADVDGGKISILAPIGTAIIGYRVGDTITWTVPGGKKTLLVKSILYQPEAAGDYHL